MYTNNNININSFESNWNTLGLLSTEKFVAEVSMREKERCTNKRNDKQKVDYSLIHNTTCYTQCLYEMLLVLEIIEYILRTRK